MGERRTPDYMMFQYIMWSEMEQDSEWTDTMDELSYQLPPGETWPKE